MRARRASCVAALMVVTLMVSNTGAMCLADEGQQGEPKPLAIGDEAPDFKLKDLSDRQVHLKAVLEQKTVLLAFFATWHPRSRTQIARLKSLVEGWKGRPVQVLAVALDRGGKEVVELFARSQELNFPVLIDSELTTKDTYHIRATLPLVFVIGRDGKIKALQKALDDEALKRLREAVTAELEAEASETPGEAQ